MEIFVSKSEYVSFDAATQWYNGVIAAFSSLTEFPRRCSLAPENDTFQQEIRQLLYGKKRDTYRILFTVRDELVYILHVRHSAMQTLQPKDWEKLEDEE